jgi:hypothetical protein
MTGHWNLLFKNESINSCICNQVKLNMTSIPEPAKASA